MMIFNVPPARKLASLVIIRAASVENISNRAFAVAVLNSLTNSNETLQPARHLRLCWPLFIRHPHDYLAHNRIIFTVNMETKENHGHKRCSKPNVIWITSPWVDNKRPTEDFIQITNQELDRQADQYEKERKV